jgi:sugar O-acyltransferase (sialic acid O-acetyltransferase NeuD family)
VADILRRRDDVVLVGFLDDAAPARRGEAFCGATVLGASDRPAWLRDEHEVTALALGVGDNTARLRAGERFAAAGFGLVTAVHPAATIDPSARLGDGSVGMAGAVVNADARLGAACIVNTLAGVDHDCEVGDGVHVAPGARLAGGVRVGRGTLIGMGASVLPRMRIGAGCVIGAGAVVAADVPDGAQAVGVPARVAR